MIGDSMRLIKLSVMIMTTAALYLQADYALCGSPEENDGRIGICIEWRRGNPSGTIDMAIGRLAGLEIIEGKGEISGNKFRSTGETRFRIGAVIEDGCMQPGPGATVVTVNTKHRGFSFFLRDVTSGFPIILPEYHVCILPGDDKRSYEDVLSGLREQGLRKELEVIDGEPEESFENAARNTRNQPCPTWLGLPRDFRMFEVDVGLGYTSRQMESIQPKWATRQVTLPELDNKPATYYFVVGRGVGTSKEVVRRLEEGVLPILHTDIRDEDILYQTRSFVSLEHAPLKAENLRGTHYLVADGYSGGHMFTDEQQAEFNRLEKGEIEREEETVLFFQAKAVNTASAPKYAYFKAPALFYWGKPPYTFNREHGFFEFRSGRVFSIARLNG